MDQAGPAKERSGYDLYLRDDDRRFFWKMVDRGIALEDGGVVWTINGSERKAAFAEIGEVHLQSGGVGGKTVASCRIRLSDWSVLNISSGGERGGYDADQARLFREFTRDFLRRLAALPKSSIAFTAGYDESRYRFAQIAITVAFLFFVCLPAVLVLITRELKAVGILVTGAFFVWPLYQIVVANEPRSFDPRYPPDGIMDEELTPGRLDWRSWFGN